MIHEAYMPVYRCPDFHCVVRTGPPEVVQEALADLKNRILSRFNKMSSSSETIISYLSRI